jgi:23S rRNA pseudouridine2605 synthase
MPLVMSKERLQKIIAAAGVMSRRKAEEAILQGRVRLNGAIVTELGTQAEAGVDRIEVDDAPVGVRAAEDKRTVVFYKPRGCMTTKHDDRGRRTVMDYFTDDPALNPVGRLDFESEGLLLMTHDGDLLLRLTHPRYGFEKKYEVTVTGEWTNAITARLLGGVELEDGPGRFDRVEKLTSPDSTFLVTVSEGRNRFIRRMISAVGLEVTRLKRVEMGPVRLKTMKAGERRELTTEEHAAIDAHRVPARTDSAPPETDE